MSKTLQACLGNNWEAYTTVAATLLSATPAELSAMGDLYNNDAKAQETHNLIVSSCAQAHATAHRIADMIETHVPTRMFHAMIAALMAAQYENQRGYLNRRQYDWLRRPYHKVFEV